MVTRESTNSAGSNVNRWKRSDADMYGVIHEGASHTSACCIRHDVHFGLKQATGRRICTFAQHQPHFTQSPKLQD